MAQYSLRSTHKTLLADTATPVSIYLRLRDEFPNSILLESSDYHARGNSMSFICCDPIAHIRIEDGMFREQFPDGISHAYQCDEIDIPQKISDFGNAFRYETDKKFNFSTGGLFGYFTYDTVQYFEDIRLSTPKRPERAIPEMQYHVYRYVIAINHFRNELHIFEHHAEGTEEKPGGIERIELLIRNKNIPEYHFRTEGEESSNMTDAELLDIMDKLKAHIGRGDVFQIVPSRSFSQAFRGDEFNVYRALRSVNPSPYLFYFDYGNFKLFGSSPEAQLTVKNRVATIYPIAGTFRRSGDDEADAILAEKLMEDPKENAEHVMLVDLARNDLSIHCDKVQVEKFREVQYYSHVIHLVSTVSGKLRDEVPTMKIVAKTFPAGTLSGAPKYRAMQLIDEHEKGSRSFYAGAIGFMGFNGDFNHAIMIRSFLSKQNVLHFQAGFGFVADSVHENELQEVSNKLAALKKAIEMAGDI
ncbi:anthranilate synthase component 1 [Anseongella ginsenosidimutans]|uniref:Anthranilate synthase component 1 n=1 Tax=Anseongella ginsenosidimutans TaxID=496056 RepID=A0A4R3KMT3_9SPHI|nr:anthranilate synthase component I family protein [Anseongella ginsenosidimutans]TCS85682.1 anthranilate synthase component 1 [Anseongella ginsenosidimutans]